MNSEYISKLFALVGSKIELDEKANWSEGSTTYFQELKKEIDEVSDELDSNRQCYLEDELGDVFWDYLNLLQNLEAEGKILTEKVFERASKKYEERLTAISSGSSWSSIKAKQKLELETELKRAEDLS
jgi:NTP pyrophosphatase (non-canonical NTP hydrolase)